ncbi:MAG: hypothetical protein K0R02_697 [Rickettsiaceae bacterium]|jgi:hypothetical protein|nr:hypothetical protein [Rickettsiaceae bacterium]
MNSGVMIIQIIKKNKKLSVEMEEAILVVLLKNGYQARDANFIAEKMTKYLITLEERLKGDPDSVHR